MYIFHGKKLIKFFGRKSFDTLKFWKKDLIRLNNLILKAYAHKNNENIRLLKQHSFVELMKCINTAISIYNYMVLLLLQQQSQGINYLYAVTAASLPFKVKLLQQWILESPAIR